MRRQRRFLSEALNKALSLTATQSPRSFQNETIGGLIPSVAGVFSFESQRLDGDYLKVKMNEFLSFDKKIKRILSLSELHHEWIQYRF